MSTATTHPEIAAVCDLTKLRDQAEVALLHGVIEWSVAYRVDRELVDETTFGDNGVLLGGAGCPLVKEFDVYDLAVRMGMSTDSGCHYVARILEVRYRLTKIWEQVTALTVPVWKAFKVADATMNLTWEAARFIDRMLAPTLRSASFAQIERTIVHAIDLHDPDEAERRRTRAADDRCFDIHLSGRAGATDSRVDIAGTLSLEDALDLDTAIKAGATTLSDLGSEESLDVRRAMAVGEMARNQLTLHLDPDDHPSLAGRGVTLFAHLDPDTLHATLDNPGAADVLIEQIRAWCQTVGNTVTITPVIDLDTTISTHAYTPTDTLVEQVRLRDQCCVFPNCTRRARHCDLDHLIPYDHDNPDAGGPTTTENLALLCRKHHRTKTFSPWTYASPQPGVYDWTSPSGARFRVTRGHRHGRLPITNTLDDPPEP